MSRVARVARVVVPGVPHHVTLRSNRGAQVFFSDADCAVYLGLIAAGKAGTEVWAWCLMPNHVHIVAVPSRADGLAPHVCRCPPPQTQTTPKGRDSTRRIK